MALPLLSEAEIRWKEHNARRRSILHEIDSADDGWLRGKLITVAGVGLFTDAYDVFSISIVATMLGYVYNNGMNSLGGKQDLGIKVAVPFGNLVGQLFFGWLADRLGRKRMYGVELMIILVCTFAQALVSQGPRLSITGVIIVWRFLLGVGIGGDYPSSSVLSSELAPTTYRGRMVSAVFGFQGLGQTTSAIVSLIAVSALRNSIVDSVLNVDVAWRIIIGVGCIPAVIALYYRLTIPESPRFTIDVERDILQASQDVDAIVPESECYIDDQSIEKQIEVPRATFSDFYAYFSQWENGKVLLGTALSWFLIDIAFYGLALNSTTILQDINFFNPTANSTNSSQTCISDSGPPGRDCYRYLFNAAIGNTVLSAVGLLPGYVATYFVIDKWGRKPIQLVGFAALTVLFIVMAASYERLTRSQSGAKAFAFLYFLTNFFFNFGPNTITFILPSGVFPTRYRSTAHGISAACGKLGAIISQVGFSFIIRNRQHINTLFAIFAAFMFVGIFSTLLIPETNGKTLEELSNEEFIRLERRRTRRETR